MKIKELKAISSYFLSTLPKTPMWGLCYSHLHGSFLVRRILL